MSQEEKKENGGVINMFSIISGVVCLCIASGCASQINTSTDAKMYTIIAAVLAVICLLLGALLPKE